MFSDHQIVQYYTLKSLEQDRPNLVLWKISVWDRFYLADQTLENTVTTGTIEEFWLPIVLSLAKTFPPTTMQLSQCYSQQWMIASIFLDSYPIFLICFNPHSAQNFRVFHWD